MKAKANLLLVWLFLKSYLEVRVICSFRTPLKKENCAVLLECVAFISFSLFFVSVLVVYTCSHLEFLKTALAFKHDHVTKWDEIIRGRLGKKVFGFPENWISLSIWHSGLFCWLHQKGTTMKGRLLPSWDSELALPPWTREALNLPNFI